MGEKPQDESAKRGHPAQPTTDEQSGSAGRKTSDKDNPGKDSGQGRYGQSGLGGKQKPVDPQRRPESEEDSNFGSGRPDRESQDYDNPSKKP
jgi:hypothetical protein